MSIKTLFSLFMLTLTITACKAKELGTNQTVAQEITTLVEHDKDTNMRLNNHNKIFEKYIYLIDSTIASAEKGTDRSPYQLFFYNDSFGPNTLEYLKELVFLLPQKTPRLHALVNQACDECYHPMPPLFITKAKDALDAVEIYISPINSILILGQKLIEEKTDEELKAIITDEMKRFKGCYNYKQMITLLLYIGAYIGLWTLLEAKFFAKDEPAHIRFFKTISIIISTSITIELIYEYISFLIECFAEDAAIDDVKDLKSFNEELAYYLEQLKTIETLDAQKTADIKDSLNSIKSQVHKKISCS